MIATRLSQRKDSPVTRTADYLVELWLLTDDFLLNELTEQTMQPLAALTGKQQQRFGETLMAWLECNGSTLDIADALMR